MASTLLAVLMEGEALYVELDPMEIYQYEFRRFWLIQKILYHK